MKARSAARASVAGQDQTRRGATVLGTISAAPHGQINFAGKVLVLFGRASGFPGLVEGASLDGTDGLQIEGTHGLQFLGDSLANAGDVDHDGFDDLLLTHRFSEDSQQSTGFVIHARSARFPAVVAVEQLIDGRGGFGFVLPGFPNDATAAGLGDINGDGLNDVAIARVEDFSSRGSIYVVFGGAVPRPPRLAADDFDGRNGMRIDGGLAAGRAGRCLAGVGVFNGDGVDDFAIGADFAKISNDSAGLARVLHGRRGPWPARFDLGVVPESEGLVVTDLQVSGDTGWSLAGAGDINHDGGQDLLISSPSFTVGWAHVVHGVSPVLFRDGFD